MTFQEACEFLTEIIVGKKSKTPQRKPRKTTKRKTAKRKVTRKKK